MWSMWEVRDFTEVLFPGATFVDYNMNWGEPISVQIPENATWLDLWRAADQAIIKSGDDHHIFVEKFIKSGSHLNLVTGS